MTGAERRRPRSGVEFLWILVSCMAHEVFISHAHKDKGIADAICRELESANARCWIAPRNISTGEDWTKAIRKAIDVLNQGTMRLAELMMDTAVSTALKGKTMDEADMGEGSETGHPVAKADFK